MIDQHDSNGPSDRQPMAVSQVPARPDIELPAYYPEFDWYYPTCEMRTKEWFVRHVERDWVILDAGANVGVYSILFAQLAPEGRVYAFEPTETYDMLLRNLEHNGITNVEAQRLALGQEDGTRRDAIFKIWGQDADIRDYPFTTVDSFVKSHDLHRVDAIKIDVDSFDFEVLRGAEETLRRFDPFVMIEINPEALARRSTVPQQVFDWLLERGYEKARIYDGENFLLKRQSYISRDETPLLPLGWPAGEVASVSTLAARLGRSLPTAGWGNYESAAPPPAGDTLADGPVLRYLFRHFAPKRHLEFGTWKGEGVKRVLDECAASVWTINLWEGESDAGGAWSYGETESTGAPARYAPSLAVRTDAKEMIGRVYLEAGLGHRVCQIYADSRRWDDSAYPDGFFDSVFVDGGHSAEVSRADMYKALRLLRPGGLLLLHDFCPRPEVNAQCSSTVGVTGMVAGELEHLRALCQDVFWIEDSWLLAGIRRQDQSPEQRALELNLFIEARQRGLADAEKELAAKTPESRPDPSSGAAADFHQVYSSDETPLEYMSYGEAGASFPTSPDDHIITPFFNLPPGAEQVFRLALTFPEPGGDRRYWCCLQDEQCNIIASAPWPPKDNEPFMEIKVSNCPPVMRVMLAAGDESPRLKPSGLKVELPATRALSSYFDMLGELERLRNQCHRLNVSLWGRLGRKLGLVEPDDQVHE